MAPRSRWLDCCIGEDAGITVAGSPEIGYGRDVVEIGRAANADAGCCRVAAIPKVASMCTGFGAVRFSLVGLLSDRDRADLWTDHRSLKRNEAGWW